MKVILKRLSHIHRWLIIHNTFPKLSIELNFITKFEKRYRNIFRSILKSIIPKDNDAQFGTRKLRDLQGEISPFAKIYNYMYRLSQTLKEKLLFLISLVEKPAFLNDYQKKILKAPVFSSGIGKRLN